MAKHLVLPLGLVQMARSELPDCTWESCPVCLEDAKTPQNISLLGPDGLMYETGLRLARAPMVWDSQSMMMTVWGILYRDKLGMNVQFTDVLDEYATMRGMLGCAGYMNDACDEQPRTLADALRLVAEGTKIYPDPLPDIFMSLEVWPGALTLDGLSMTADAFDKGNVIGYGSTGFLLKEWLWIIPEAASVAWTGQELALTNYLAWTTDAIKTYVSTPQQYMDDGVVAETQGCPGDPAVADLGDPFQTLLDLGYVCNNSWWLTPACAAFGNAWTTECAAVLDDDWGYVKPEVWGALSKLDMRVAKLTAGYGGLGDVIKSRKYNASFLWWDTDTQFVSLRPLGVQLAKEVDTESLIIQKVATRAAAKYSTKVDTMIKSTSISNAVLNTMLELVADAVANGGHLADLTVEPGFYDKVACDWVRAHPDDWAGWLPSPTTCNSGEVYDNITEVCQPCESGTRFLAEPSGKRCVACTPGRAQPLIGQKECTMCDLGMYTDEVGAKTCIPCPVGTYADTVGASACSSCSENRTRPELWTSLRQVTSSAGTGWFPTDGASNASTCGCVEGAWMGPGGYDCQDCMRGMSCAGGFGFEVASGFYSSQDEPTSFYLCLDTSNCLGGTPGDCPGDRVGLLCEACPAMQSDLEKSAKTCKKCKDGSSRLLLIAAAVYVPVIGVIAHIYNMRNKEIKLNMNPISGFATLVGAQVGMFQIVGIVSKSSVSWPVEFAAFQGFSGLFMFDISVLQLRCGWGESDFGHYTIRACIFIFFFFGIWLCHLITQPFSMIRWDWRATMNFSGQIFLVTFTTMVAVSAMPMSCYLHPSGLTSTREYPAVICGEPDHKNMLAVGIVFFILTVSAAAALCFAVYKAPALSRRSLRAMVFMVNNYRAEAWYWGVVRVVRSVLLAMTQVVFPSDGVAQIFTYSLILIVTALAQAILWPWKLPIMNWADSMMTAALIMVIFLSGMSIYKDPQQKDLSGPLMSAMMAVMISATVASGIYMARTILRPPKPKDKRCVPELVAAWKSISGNVAKQTPDAIWRAFDEIAVYDKMALANALAILASCGLSPESRSRSMTMLSARSLRLAPPSSQDIRDASATSNTVDVVVI